MKKLITWLYVKYVFIPGLKRLRKETDSKAYFLVERCDDNWPRIQEALEEGYYETHH